MGGHLKEKLTFPVFLGVNREAKNLVSIQSQYWNIKSYCGVLKYHLFT